MKLTVIFQFNMTYFKNNLLLFEEQINLCNKSQKLNDLIRVTLAAFAIPIGCPVVISYVTSPSFGKLSVSCSHFSYLDIMRKRFTNSIVFTYETESYLGCHSQRWRHEDSCNNRAWHSKRMLRQFDKINNSMSLGRIVRRGWTSNAEHC